MANLEGKTLSAAVQNLLGGDESTSRAQKPEIVADAAYATLTKPSREFTGRFCVDEDVLRAEGVTDLDHHACLPGAALLPDFFV